jgi:nucleotide-binding universal stress UspA family protein
MIDTERPPDARSESHTDTNAKTLRILVPINATEESRWGIEYALRQHRKGKHLEVVLLNVGEPITQWQVLRFRTQQEIEQFQAERAQAFIEDASQPLAENHITSRGVFKQGDLVFSILDAAEELDCDEIAMPAPHRGISSIFSNNIALSVRRQQRDIPVVFVNSEGMPG